MIFLVKMFSLHFVRVTFQSTEFCIVELHAVWHLSRFVNMLWLFSNILPDSWEWLAGFGTSPLGWCPTIVLLCPKYGDNLCDSLSGCKCQLPSLSSPLSSFPLIPPLTLLSHPPRSSFPVIYPSHPSLSSFPLLPYLTIPSPPPSHSNNFKTNYIDEPGRREGTLDDIIIGLFTTVHLLLYRQTHFVGKI